MTLLPRGPIFVVISGRCHVLHNINPACSYSVRVPTDRELLGVEYSYFGSCSIPYMLYCVLNNEFPVS